MQLWEGAILVVGGVFLVSYMAKNKASAVSAAGTSTAATSTTGLTNTSNLTNQTNQAGGYPTVAGESLEAPARPVLGTIVHPVTSFIVGRRTVTPVVTAPANPRIPVSTLQKPVIPSASNIMAL